MTVLSDGTIRKLMERQELVIGDPERAKRCSYEFLPAKIFPGGHMDDNAFVIDWTSPEVRDSSVRHTIMPAAVVWVRALHTVRLPKNVCGLWIKTNTLSRQGLMMINSSLVEPGYEGPLSCNFVNFGKEPVILTPNSPIAKLLFFRLDCDSEKPFDIPKPDYDQEIAKTAAHGPATFLQVSEIAESLRRERDRLVAEIDATAKKLVTEIDATAKKLIEDERPKFKLERESELATMKSDFHGYVAKILWWAGGAVVVFAAATWLSDLGRGYFSSDRVKKTEVEAMIEKEVAKRMTNSASAVTAPLQPLSPTLQPVPSSTPKAPPP